MTKQNESKLILEVIKGLQKKHTVSKLSGGNCGTFALAVQSVLSELGFKSITFGVLFRDPNGECQSVKDIIAMETDVYHVVLEYKNDFYDGTGKTSIAKLLQLAKMDYKDNSPSFIGEIDANDKHIKSLIDNDTNWTIPVDKFQKTILSLMSP